jgi:hypothetical protein
VSDLQHQRLAALSRELRLNTIRKELFPTDQPGEINIGAFRRAFPDITYPFPPTGGPCQAKLVRNRKDQWWLLAYRCEPNDSENGDDYVDVYPVKFFPAFEIADR